MIWLIVIGVLILVFGITALFGAPYVPSHQLDVSAVFNRLAIGPRDLVVDIGSGDGRILRQAAIRGAQAVGYEINPLLVLLSWVLNRRFAHVTVRFANFWTASIPQETTIIYAFSVNRDRRRLVRKVQAEAERLGAELTLVCYGSPLRNRRPTQTIGAYSVYRFQPLQPPKAQV